VEKLGDLAIVDCKGRIVAGDAVLRLRDAVMELGSASVIALDLYEVQAIGGAALGMLGFLQRWANEHHIRLKLFSPSRAVISELERFRQTLDLDIASLHEMMTILSRADRRYSMAA
jgi:anti-anti-sigma regulatory factor